MSESAEGLLPLRLDLVAHYVDTDGREHAILYRPESRASPGPDGRYPEELNWSAIPDKGRRASFVLLSDRKEHLRPWGRAFAPDEGGAPLLTGR